MRNAVFAALCVFAAASLFAQTPCREGWSYCDPSPNQWAPHCQSGKTQSPIDLVTSTTTTEPRLEFNYATITPRVKNTFYSYKIVNPQGSLKYLGDDYPLIEFHFHVPGEHTINGVAAPMELHLVHGRGGNPEVVVGVLYKDGTPSSALSAIVNVLPPEECTEANAPTLNPVGLLQLNVTKFFRYRGSLTTPSPTCREGLTWIVFEDRAGSTLAQRNAMQNGIGPNARQSRAAGPDHRLELVTVIGEDVK